MRINVYAEELTTDVCFITKDVDGRRFYGVRMFLKSAEELHHTFEDDDRSAITFWVPWYGGENHHDELRNTFIQLLSSQEAAARDDLRGHDAVVT